jgi:hypothetical protein
MMWHYAHIYTINNGGAAAELKPESPLSPRAPAFALLKVVKNAGRKELVQVDLAAGGRTCCPAGSKSNRRQNGSPVREGTYKAHRRIANTRVRPAPKRRKLESFESR